MTLTKAKFGKLTGVDHFYVGFTKREINDLKVLRHLPYCSFSKVKSGKDSWQGIYWSTTASIYFEMIESPEPGHYNFGVALSAKQIQYTDIRNVKSLFKGAKALKSSTRIFPNKRKWFEAVYSPRSQKSLIHIWAMHYFFGDRERKFRANPEPSILERFTELEINVNPKFLRDLRENCYWVPYKIETKGNVAILEFANKDHSPLRIKCNVMEEVEHVDFVSMTAQASPFRKELPKMKYFDLIYKKDSIILKRKNATK